MALKEISVIIPNYNGENLLKENLPLVVSATNFFNLGGGCSEIIVVDDASEDNSISVLKKFKNIKIVKHTSNKGYAEAVYSGVISAKYRYVFLLNSDVKIPENIFEELLKPFTNQDTFASSPVITNINGRISSGSYKVPFIKRGELKFEKWKHLKFKKEEMLNTLFCSGGSALIDKDKFLSLKGFHPIYKPFYYEDTDICVRAWKKGWQSYFVPSVSVIHHHQSTIKKFHKNFYIKTIMRRNRFFLLWSNLPFKFLLFNHIPNVLPRIVSYSIKFDFSYLSGLICAILNLKSTYLKRKNEPQTFFEIIDLINKDFRRIKPD